MKRITRVLGQLTAALCCLAAAPAAADAATLVNDTFTRQMTGGWGTADVGGAWSVLQGPSSALSVNGAQGVLNTPAGYGNERIAQLGSKSARDVDVTARMTFPEVKGTNASAFASLVLRRQSDGRFDRVGLLARPSGNLIIVTQTNAWEYIVPDVDTGIAFTPGAYMLRVQVQGANPTTIRAKVWKAGTTQPTEWKFQRTTTKGPQVAGTVGLRTIAVNTASPINFTFDDVNVADIPLPTADMSKWRQVFSDDFNGTALNAASWSAFNGPGHAGNGLRRPAQITVANGSLTATAQMINGVINAGGVSHRANYKYGRFEFRVRTEADPSQGTAGTILTWPSNGGWPATGENDIYETGSDPDRTPFHSFVHYDTTNKQYFTSHFVDGTQWHDMAMEWEPDAIRIYRDGVLVWTLTDANAIPDGYHRFGIQLDAVRPTMSGVVRMYVDYVRIYQRA